MKIGIFDSGLGGLAILRDILAKLPEYDYVYLGDNARVPYGGRSQELIYKFTQKAVEFLFSQNCQLIILACNSASASALRQIQQQYLPKHYPDRRVLGVIRPTVEAVFEQEFQRVGLIGTYSTVNSQAFVTELKHLNKNIKVWQQAAPLLVPVVEEGKLDWPGLNLLFKEYIKPLTQKNIQALILGCTHYGLLEKQIQSYLCKEITVFSEGKVVAEKLKDYLNRHPEIETKLAKNHKRHYYISDFNQRYKTIAKMFLGDNFDQNYNLVSL